MSYLSILVTCYMMPQRYLIMTFRHFLRAFFIPICVPKIIVKQSPEGTILLRKHVASRVRSQHDGREAHHVASATYFFHSRQLTTTFRGYSRARAFSCAKILDLESVSVTITSRRGISRKKSVAPLPLFYPSTLRVGSHARRTTTRCEAYFRPRGTRRGDTAKMEFLGLARPSDDVPSRLTVNNSDPDGPQIRKSPTDLARAELRNPK